MIEELRRRGPEWAVAFSHFVADQAAIAEAQPQVPRPGRLSKRAAFRALHEHLDRLSGEGGPGET